MDEKVQLVALIPHYGASYEVFGEDLDPIIFRFASEAKKFWLKLENRGCVEFHVMTELDHGGWVH